MQGFVHNLTPAFCLELPKRLSTLKLLIHASAAEPRLLLPQFDTPELRPPLVWEYLDKIPRFLCMDLYDTVPFTALLAERQLDDRIEDCPNVAIGSHPAGSGRPGNTPRCNEKSNQSTR